MSSHTRRPLAAFVKRIFDVFFALAALIVALPAIAVTAILIRLESPGNPIFRQTRVGLNGRKFTILKLRTMVQNAERIGAGIYAVANDPRFTRVGTFARRYSLDELPQLINVLKGDMSIVGPRPMLPVTIAEYKVAYDQILKVKPGITGLAQVSGRNLLSRSHRMALDSEYARNWSLGGDLKILARTVSVALTGEGQLNSQSAADVEK